MNNVKSFEPTHEIVDFGDGPIDETLDYPFCGSELECSSWLIINGKDRSSDGKPRFALQEIPND